MGQHDDMEADAICSAVERMDGEITALVLNELPTDDYYEGCENAAESKGEDETPSAQTGLSKQVHPVAHPQCCEQHTCG